MSWDKVSDDVIDYAVFSELCKGAPEDWSAKRVWDSLLEKPSYTRSWDDMGPVIADNSIDLEWPEYELGGVGQVSKYVQGGMDIQIEFRDKRKALRAAAIVYLMMNNVKPEDLTGGNL